jgi:hypothetical protein
MPARPLFLSCFDRPAQFAQQLLDATCDAAVTLDLARPDTLPRIVREGEFEITPLAQTATHRPESSQTVSS